MPESLIFFAFDIFIFVMIIKIAKQIEIRKKRKKEAKLQETKQAEETVWIPAESVDKGGSYNNPLMLEYKDFRYENKTDDPFFIDKLIEAKADKKLVIPYGFTGTGYRAFRNFPDIEEIVLPDSVKTCYSSFDDLKNLKIVVLPSGLTEIDYSLFNNCEKLENVILPDTVSCIGGNAFHNCKSLKNIELPFKVKKIESDAFSGCTNLSSIRLTENLESIGASAFSGCKSLKEITLPESINCIPNDCFAYCDGLEYILLKGKNTEWIIGESAFSCCSCNIFVEAASFEEKNLTQSDTRIEMESGAWWEETIYAWNTAFYGNIYFAGEWHYDENGKPVKNTF